MLAPVGPADDPRPADLTGSAAPPPAQGPRSAHTATQASYPAGGGPVGGTGGIHLTDSQVQSEASHILGVGDRTLWTDDYDARMRAFGGEMGQLDADSAKRLFEAVTSKDGGAYDSWLQGPRMLDQVKDPDQQAAIVNAFSRAYQEGKAGDSWQALDFLSGGQGSALTQGAMAVESGGLSNVDKVLGAGSYWITDGVRETLGGDLMKQYVGQQGNFNMAGAALATHIMSGSPDPTMTARVYAGFNADDRAKIFQGVNEMGQGYVRTGQADPMAQLVNSVDSQSWNTLSRTPDGKTYGDLAVELVRDANIPGDLDGRPLFPNDDRQADPGRAQAFSQLFIDNRDKILDTMTDTRHLDLDASTSNPNDTYVGNDGVALANLLRATALDSGNPLQKQMTASLSGYIREQKDAINGTDETARQQGLMHLGGLGAASTEAVSQLGDDLAGDQAARQAVVGFLADVALSAVPVAGGALSKEADKALTDMFGDGIVQKLSSKVSGKLIDTATGTLTDQAKQQLVDLVGSDDAAILDKTNAINHLHDAIYQDAGSYQTELDSTFTTMQDQIALSR